MSGAYGVLYVSFYDTNLALTDGGNPVLALNASGTTTLSRVGTGKIEAILPPNEATTYYDRGWKMGNIAVAYQYNFIYGAFQQVACFIIDRQPQLSTNSDGMVTISASGPDMLKELANMKSYIDVGSKFTTHTKDSAAGINRIVMDELGTLETTVLTGDTMHSDEDSVRVTSTTGFEVGDPIVIELNDTTEHRDIIREVITGPTPELKFENLPGESADPGNRVGLPLMSDGDSLRVTNDPGSDHDYFYSRFERNIGYHRAYMQHTIPPGDGWGIGNVVEVISSTTETQEDIQQITEQAVDRGWAIDLSNAGTPGTGTLSGTNHKVDGASIIQILIAAANVSGEYFRLQRTTAQAPERKMGWYGTPDSSGIHLIQPTQAQANAGIAYNTSYAVIESISRETEWSVITEIAPQGGGKYSTIGEDSWSLNDATDNVEGPIAAYPGFSQYVEYGQWVIKNDSATLAGLHIHEKQVFSDIEPKSSSASSKTEAADLLQERAVTYLGLNDTPKYFYRAKCRVHGEIFPGQSATLTARSAAPHWDENATTVYVVEVTHSVSDGGGRVTELLLSLDSPINRMSGNAQVAGALLGASGSGGVVSSSGGSGGSGVSPAHTHDSYLLADGTRDLTGNLAVDALVTIDGVDLSVHAATANAHHDPVTVDSNFTLTGQDIDLITTTDGAANPEVVLTTDTNGDFSTRRFEAEAIGVNTTPQTGTLKLNATLLFEGSQSIKNTASDLLIQPQNDLFLDPVGQIWTTEDVFASGFTSGFLGNKWGITDAGVANFRTIQSDELFVKTFSADHSLVVTGSHYVSPGMGEVANDNATVPAVSSSTTITFLDNPALGGIAIFKDGSKGFIRISNSDNGGLNYALVWGTISNYSDNGDGTQDWTFTSGELSASVAGDTIPEGAVLISWGVPGDGVWSVTTNDPTSGPYAQIQIWNGSDPWTESNRQTRVRIGDLLGLGIPGYGFFAGRNGLAGPHLAMTDIVSGFQDVPISMTQGTGDSGHIRFYAVAVSSSLDPERYPDGDITAGPTGETLTRSSGTGTWYSHVAVDPDVGDTLFLYTVPNKGLDYASFNLGDLTEGADEYTVKVRVTKHTFTDDFAVVYARLYEPTFGYLTDETRLFSTDEMPLGGTAYVFETTFNNHATTATGVQWAAARLRLYVRYDITGGSEVIRLEPKVLAAGQGPYMAVGSPIPEGVWTNSASSIGFIAGRRASGQWGMRVGGGISDTTTPAMLYTSSSGLLIYNSLNKSTPVLWFDNSGNAYIKQQLTIDSATGSIVAGNLFIDEDKIAFNTSSGYVAGEAYGFINSGTYFGGMSAYGGSTINEIRVKTGPQSARHSRVRLEAESNSGYASTLTLYTNYYSTTKRAELEVTSSSSSNYFWFKYADYADFDMPIYSKSLSIDQLGSAGYSISLGDTTDLSGLTTQGMDTAYQYARLWKVSDLSGGLAIQGAGSSTYGTFLIGSANTGSSTHSQSAIAPLIFSGRIDNGAPATGENAIAFRAGSITRLIMETDGQLWSNYGTALSTYGEEDDDALLRQLEFAVDPKAKLRGEFDGWVETNQSRLEELGIWDNGFMNLHKLNMLEIGALTGHGFKIKEMSDKIKKQDDIIRALAKLVGLDVSDHLLN